jgi:hypothetical protein
MNSVPDMVPTSHIICHESATVQRSLPTIPTLSASTSRQVSLLNYGIGMTFRHSSHIHFTMLPMHLTMFVLVTTSVVFTMTPLVKSFTRFRRVGTFMLLRIFSLRWVDNPSLISWSRW